MASTEHEEAQVRCTEAAIDSGQRESETLGSAVNWKRAYTSEHRRAQLLERAILEDGITAEDIDAYLESLHCSAWGYYGSIHKQKGRDGAAEFILKTLAGVRAHKLNGADNAAAEQPRSAPAAIEAQATH